MIRPTVIVRAMVLAALYGASAGLAANPTASMATPSTAATGAQEPADEPLFAAPTRADRIGRIVAPVMINGRGPYRFIVDTGASRSVVSPRLVAELGLTPSAEATVMVTGVTGTAPAHAVTIDSLSAGELHARKVLMPVIEPQVMTGADGILGIEGLSGLCLTADFVADRLTITRARQCRPDHDALKIPARLRHGGLLFVQVRVGGVPTTAVIDTGAERSLGNRILQRALDARPVPGAGSLETRVSGVTPELAAGDLREAPLIEIGEAEIRRLEVAFGDLHVFRVWGLDQGPALIIGMDLLGLLRKLVINYGSSVVYVTPPDDR